MKILVTCPCLNLLGGVANHYIGLKSYWRENVRYQEIGRRNGKKNSGKYWLPWDVAKFIKNILIFRPDCILLNHSIGISALKRDFILQKIAHLFHLKTAVFIHGFDLDAFEKMGKSWLRENLNNSACIFVLAKKFRDQLVSIGVSSPIVLATTKVDDALLNGFDINCRDGKTGNMLFLSRVEKAKGIYETLETFKILKQDYPELKLQIVGDGSEINNVTNKIKAENINNVIISGKLSGRDVAAAYKNAKLLFLLSTHGEGMPTAVLEGMAFGLPVFTRPVGGLADFFETGKMGVMSETLNPDLIANSVRPFLDNPQLTKEVALYNHRYATNNFMASKVARFIETSLKSYL